MKQTFIQAIDFCCKTTSGTLRNCKEINPLGLTFSGDYTNFPNEEFFKGYITKGTSKLTGLSVYNSKACHPDANCATCSSSDSCPSCSPGFYRDTSVSPPKCLSACPDGFRGTESYTCEACTANCTSCPSSSTVCAACKSSYYLRTVNGGISCISSCPDGYGINGSKCSKCKDDSCAACSFTDGVETGCLTLKDEATCSGLSCVGRALYNNNEVYDECVGCSVSFCENCPDDVCNDCEGNRVGTTCACPPGHYGTSATCTPCSAQLCNTCSTGSACDTCVENAILDGTNCVCKTGYYKFGSACVTCDQIDPLKNCDATGGSPECKDNSSIQGGVCTCNDGYYNLRNECTACSDLCGTCDKARGCSACEAGAGNDQDNCDCTYGYYESTPNSDKVCTKCDLALCEDCEVSSTCKICVANATYDLFDNIASAKKATGLTATTSTA